MAEKARQTLISAAQLVDAWGISPASAYKLLHELGAKKIVGRVIRVPVSVLRDRFGDGFVNSTLFGEEECGPGGEKP